VVVNQDRIVEALGGTADQAQIEAKLAEIRQLAIAAAGVSSERDDLVQVTAVEFMEGVDGVPLSEPGIIDLINEHLGTVINALSFVAATLLVVFMGLRPLVKALSGGAAVGAGAGADSDFGDMPALEDGTLGDTFGADDEMGGLPGLPDLPSLPSLPSSSSSDPSELLAKMRPSPEERLTMIVDLDEERAASILRRWVRQEAA
jgi:flagellar M-ring protein FliF